MATGIDVRRISHMNLVVDDFDASLKHFQDLFGAELILDLPSPAWHAYLVEIGNVIIEMFCPAGFMLNSRNGPHHLGIEYLADLDEARAVSAEQGVGIMRDIVLAIHTDPADGFGVDYEFYDGSFHDNDPPVLTQTIKPLEYWHDEHPLGCIGQKGHTQVVGDIDAATTFLKNYLKAEFLYEADRPDLRARAIGMQVADGVIETLTPTGPGALQTEMYRTGEGIRSTVFKVRDLEQARGYFEDKGVALIAGTLPDTFAIAPEDNLGILFEYSE